MDMRVTPPAAGDVIAALAWRNRFAALDPQLRLLQTPFDAHADLQACVGFPPGRTGTVDIRCSS